MTRSNYYDEIAYLMAKIHTCREKRMELMKEYASIEHSDPYRNDSFYNQVIQYKIDLNRIYDNIQKVEKRHADLKCQFERRIQHDNNAKVHDNALNTRESSSMPLSGVTPSLLDKNGKHAIIGEKSVTNILKPQLSGLSTSTGRKSIFADRHHDKIQNNRKKDTGVSCSQLQQVIKRTKQILDAQEITLNSISFDTTQNNNDDGGDNEDMTSCKQPANNAAEYHDEIKSIEVNEKREKKTNEETFSRPLSKVCTLSESKSPELSEKLLSLCNTIISPDLCYKQQTSSTPSHNSTISFMHINNNDKCIEKKFKENNLQPAFIENSPQINDEKDKGDTEEEEEEQQQQQNEKDEGGDREDTTEYTTNTSVSDENNRLQRGQSYEEFLAKATFSIEESTCNYVNESNDHESEFDSALLKNHEDTEKSNKLLDMNNTNLLSSWTTYKTEELADESDSFYD
ncbi:unnamed protein product [Trichobilharzia szidati]|nr:unnamed protein product [Trichobilharzia szidati]